MGNEWTLGAVGPEQRAVMYAGTVWAVAETEQKARTMVRDLNNSLRPHANGAVIRDEVEKLRDELITEQQVAEAHMRTGAIPWTGGPTLAREDVIERLTQIMKVGTE